MIEEISWHNLPSTETLRLLYTNAEKGLSEEEIEKRWRKFGRNKLPEVKRSSRLRLFLKQFQNFLVYLIFLAAIVSLFLKQYIDAGFISIVIFINGLVSFYQEAKSSKTVARLKKIIKTNALVLRGGRKKKVLAENLVPGDIIFLKAGDRVPADARLLKAENFKTNEMVLTGEWLPSEKTSSVLPRDTVLADRANMVYMGTIIEAGIGLAVVTETGARTEFGKIADLVNKPSKRKTPLQQKISNFSKLFGLIVLGIFVILLIIGGLRKISFTDLFTTGISLAVSAIPEGLLPAVTIVLVLGARKVLKRKGLIKNLSATETLGSTRIILTDKTGTLTEGRMKVSNILTGSDFLENHPGNHDSILRAVSLANEAFIEDPGETENQWKINGRPTDKALLSAALEGGIAVESLRKRLKKIAEIPFDSERKYLADLYQNNDGNYELYVAGAAEKILAFSSYLSVDNQKVSLDPATIKNIYNYLEKLGEKGLRIVGVAHKNLASYPAKNDGDLTKEIGLLVFDGLIALKDHLRLEAKKSVNICKQIGVKPVIVTGDYLLTARAVASEIGLPVGVDNVIEGKNLDKLSDQELRERLPKLSICARVEPRHKLRIVKAFQDRGEVVAMTGDGVNDAPALKQADIGIALGSGTDVAKEASDMVLLDNNFSTIVSAIKEGRAAFDNIRKVTIYLTADDFSEITFITLSIILGFPLPLVPTQILGINLLEDGLPNVALTLEKEEQEVMFESPRTKKEPILSKKIKYWMVAVGLITSFLAFLPFVFYWWFTGDLTKARSLIFTITSIDSLLFAFSCRSLRHSIWRKNIFSNHYLDFAVLLSIGLLVGVLYLPFLQTFFQTTSLSIFDWFIVLSTDALEIFLVAKAKKFFLIRPSFQKST